MRLVTLIAFAGVVTSGLAAADNRPELTKDEIKACIINKDTRNELERRVDVDEAQVKKMEAAVNKLSTELVATELELESVAVDSLSRKEAKRHNKKVKALRIKVDQYNSIRVNYNTLTQRINSDISNINRMANTYNSTCANRSFFEADNRLARAELIAEGGSVREVTPTQTYTAPPKRQEQVAQVPLKRPVATGYVPTQKTGVVKRSDMYRLQKALAKLGYEISSIDGIYGPETIAAIRGYREDSGLTQEPVTLDFVDRVVYLATLYKANY